MPPKAASRKILESAFQQILSIANNSNFGTNCAKCQAGLQAGKFLALAAPELGPELAVRVCEQFNFNSDCGTQYGIFSLGSVVTQVVAAADVGGLDGQVTFTLSFLPGIRVFSDRIHPPSETPDDLQPLPFGALSSSAYIAPGPDQLVRKAEARPAS